MKPHRSTRRRSRYTLTVASLGTAVLFGSSLVNAQPAPTTEAASASAIPTVDGPEIWRDPTRTPDERAADLVRRLTLEEKVQQIVANPQPIKRLGIPAYSHRNEALHGVAAGVATVFPQAIAMAATWDTALIQREADAISTEGRAKHNDFVATHNGNTGEHFGLNYYSPNINIFRDPRWGRGQETYGEDPFLTAQIGVAFVRGIQGDDPQHPKAFACAKHFAVHSGPEKDRHHMNMQPSERDLYETYLPAFEALVRDGHVRTVMGAYSALYGQPCCASSFLLNDILRKRWGFNGLVFSDGGAIGDIWAEHHFVATPEEAAAATLTAGCDVSSGAMRDTAQSQRDVQGHANAGIKGGNAYSVLPAALQQGLVTQEQIDTAVRRELALRFALGIFDPGKGPFDQIGMEQVDSAEHRALSQKVAEESIVLLKNDGTLPLDRSKLRRIAVIGPNADSARMQNGNYAGRPSGTVTILQGIKDLVGPNVEVVSVAGSPLARRIDRSNQPKQDETDAAVAAAKSADLVIFVSGLDASLEKEEGDAKDPPTEGFVRGDRSSIELPAVQAELLQALRAANKPIVLVNCSGSAVALREQADAVPAIVQAWYPGEQGGAAVARVLFGEVNPAGRLPVTFYASTQDLPAFDDYAMTNRTYRYFTGKPLWAFGHGLSYTKFSYGDAKLAQSSIGADDTAQLSIDLKNIGDRDGDEVAQVYVHRVAAPADDAKQTLCGFARVSVAKGASTTVAIAIPAKRLRHWDEAKKDYVVASGDYQLLIGGASDAIASRVTLTVK